MRQIEVIERGEWCSQQAPAHPVVMVMVMVMVMVTVMVRGVGDHNKHRLTLRWW
jgi:hypothetical protein